MTGKTIVLTGGATGVGAATASQLLAQGDNVHVLDVVTPSNSAVTFVPCDLSDKSSIDTAIGQLPSKIDTLLNVAGIADAGAKDKVLRVNVLGLRHLTETLLPRIVDKGSVTNVASTAGQEWLRRAPIVGAFLDTSSFEEGLAWAHANEDKWVKDPYTFSKQCVVAYTYRATQLGMDRRVRFNSVSPGGVDTPLAPEFRRLMGDEQSDWSRSHTGRAAEPDEIAEVLVYLSTGKCGWLNGVDILVDGGYSAGLKGGWINFSESPLGKRIAAKQAARG